jgi:hypothetical protein
MRVMGQSCGHGIGERICGSRIRQNYPHRWLPGIQLQSASDRKLLRDGHDRAYWTKVKPHFRRCSSGKEHIWPARYPPVAKDCNGHRADDHTVPMPLGPPRASRRTRTINSRYPEGSGPTFTGYFLAKSFAAGLRLEHSGADLWNAFVRAHAQAQLTGPPEIQMDYFTRAIESLLAQGNRFDDPALALNESYWTQAVEESGYVGAQRSVAPALG